MLKQLFTSAVRVKILRLFLMNSEKEFFIRELTRELDEQINSIRRELDNLSSIGLLLPIEKDRKKYYKVNKKFILFQELKAIIQKSSSTYGMLSNKITQLGEVFVIIMSGIFVNKESKVDLLIVGDVDKEKLDDFLSNEILTSRPVRFGVISKEDYEFRLSCNDRFLKELLEDDNNIMSLKLI